MERSLKDYFIIILKGIGMGAADVVPGVSGGTIAFIVGIYEELIASIKGINANAMKLLFSFNLKGFWKTINGNFLFSIVAGIVISVFSLAKLITYLLEAYPVLVWAFFFGLVLASTWFVSKDIGRWTWITVTCFAAGTMLAFYVTIATPASTPESYWFIFLCGAVAICAMILPGISGSFILLLLGKYIFVMNAVKHLDMDVLIVFICGAAVGVIAFSHILSYALRRFHDMTIAVLSGFMLGSLNKVWPWKKVVETYTDSHGKLQSLIEENILPNQYVWQAVCLALLGFIMVCIIETVSAKSKLEKDKI